MYVLEEPNLMWRRGAVIYKKNGHVRNKYEYVVDFFYAYVQGGVH